jgi:hypothetical protein
MKMTVFYSTSSSCILTYFFARGLLIALMMEAVSTSVTSVNFYQTTRRSIPKVSDLYPLFCLQETRDQVVFCVHLSACLAQDKFNGMKTVGKTWVP